jgi:hypothetical protein
LIVILKGVSVLWKELARSWDFNENIDKNEREIIWLPTEEQDMAYLERYIGIRLYWCARIKGWFVVMIESVQ